MRLGASGGGNGGDGDVVADKRAAELFGELG